MKPMKSRKSIVAVSLLAAATMGMAQEQADKEVVTIPKEQYQKLLDEHRMLVEEMKEMKAFKAKFEESRAKALTQQADTDQALDQLTKDTRDAKALAKEALPGTSKLLLTGYGTAGFNSQERGGDRKFYATFNPLLVWKLSDKLLFEGEFEAQLEGGGTSLALEMAQLSYVANDYVTIGAGKFLNPMNYFVERQHMAWVNKLPDKPLAVYDGLLPETQVGMQVRGGVPVGSTKFGYALYAANASALNVDTGTFAPEELGTTTFDNFDNVGRHIAVGGRIGFLPFPELEVGYGFQFSDVAPPQNGDTVNAFLQSVDLSYVRDSATLKGVVNFKAQWAWSHIGGFVYDPGAAIGGPFVFDNSRSGGYVQVAYRPSRVEGPVLKNFEPVFRYDMLNQAKTPTGVDETRYTLGLNYWLGPMSVVKAAYVFDQQNGPNADRRNTVELQFATGF
jgi:hypothetical protein